MSLIREVILHYYPDWQPPDDTHEWCRCLCPFHGDETPSAAVSYDLNAFNCLACGVKGDAISIIRHEQKELTFREAYGIATELSLGGDHPIPKRSTRKPSRRVFGESGNRNGGSSVRPGVRGRSTPWS